MLRSVALWVARRRPCGAAPDVGSGVAVLLWLLTCCAPAVAGGRRVEPPVATGGSANVVAPTLAGREVPLDEVYRDYLQGFRRHPWRLETAEFERRAGEAAPFLKARLSSATGGREIWGIVQILLRLQEGGVFDAASDPDLVALVQSKAVSAPGGWSRRLRDDADQLELRERYPIGVSVARPPGSAADYDADRARALCRGCDLRAWRDRVRDLPVEELYAAQRYGWEHAWPPVVLDPELAARGASAVPMLKRRLRTGGTALMVWNVVRVLQLMRETRPYDVAGDEELLGLVGLAAARVSRDWRETVAPAAARLASGAPDPIPLRMRLGYSVHGPIPGR